MDKELDGRIHLWDDNGARAGTLTILPMGSKENTVLELVISIQGLDNFKLWLERAKDMATEVLCTQEEIRARDRATNE